MADHTPPHHVYCQFQIVPGVRWCERVAKMSPASDPTKSYCAAHAVEVEQREQERLAEYHDAMARTKEAEI